MTPEELKEQRTVALAAARRIIDGAKAAGNRGLSAHEQTAVQARFTEAREIDAKLKSIEESKGLLAAVNPGGAGLVGFDPGGDGGPMLASGIDGEKARDMFNLARSGSPALMEIAGRKAFTGSPLAPVVMTGVVGAVYPVAGSLLDLFPHRGVDGPTVRIYKTTTPAAVAALTAEGALKPDAGVVIGSMDVTAVKIAAISKVSEELLADFPEFLVALGNEVRQAIVVRENAWGAATLLGTSGLQVSTPAAGVSVVDAVADAIASLQASGIAPTAIAMSPLDLAKARKSKAATSGTYVFDPLSAGPDRLFGLTVVATPSLALNTVLLGDFAGAGWVGVRDPLKIEIGYDSDDWTKNLRTIRVEERLLLAVTMPGRIVKVTLS